MNKVNYPFWVVVNKEISDHVKSWRFIILMGIILLTCMGSLYTSLTNIGAAIKPNDPDGSFLFLKLFTASDGTLPSFVQFINFLGPLLGIALGFDAINSEQNKGTLSRMLSQPVHRDCIINAKFVAALIVIGIMLFVLTEARPPAASSWCVPNIFPPAATDVHILHTGDVFPNASPQNTSCIAPPSQMVAAGR